jgi:hypothetical protein
MENWPLFRFFLFLSFNNFLTFRKQDACTVSHGVCLLPEVQILCFWTLFIALFIFQNITFHKLDSASVFK